MIVVYILCALLVLMLMILIHELGHYIVGRKLGFKITEFSIGFGKAIWQKTNKRGEKISLRILPLGGYCAFYGEDDGEADKLTDPNDPKLFNNQKPWKRILVYLAGVTFNFISAIIFAFILLVSTGYG
ncbi:MAG: site-2 protease family protein, partial [Clostridia bacterium]|nr:site-2 protease family protein [Clostridia bacterium]